MKTPQKPKILVVDDTVFNIDVAMTALQDDYDMSVALSGKEALEAVNRELPDLILLDITMPEMDGFEVCKYLKANDLTQDIPVIFITAINSLASKTTAFEIGAADYITKPFDIKELQIRVKTQLTLKNAQEMLSSENMSLEKMVKLRTHEIERLRGAIISSLASLAESRDNDTGQHIKRTVEYVRCLGEKMLRDGIYQDLLNEDFLEMIIQATPLHDIGKVGIPDQILLKPGQLTTEEFEIMKQHTIHGRRALVVAQAEADYHPFFDVAKDVVTYHHEKWDGTGYPSGLKGSQIPISARLVALADVFDALTTRRCYKAALPFEDAFKIIVHGDGTHFDPLVVQTFLECTDAFTHIQKKFAD